MQGRVTHGPATTKGMRKTMNRKLKMLLLALLILVSVPFLTGCAQEANPYEKNDAENFSVSVKFDANGGFFTTNTSVIVDSFNVSEMAAQNGQVQIPLLSPDNSLRGNDAFTVINNGHFLAGWYTDRQETADGYVYSGKWDFEKDRVAVDVSGTYTATEPVLTLYAAWAPVFSVEFYDLSSGEYLETYTFNPQEVTEIRVPKLDEESGAMEMFKFPQRKGYTYVGAHYDAAATMPVDTETLVHPGMLDEATGTAKDTVMQLYVDWMEGEWYHIYNVEQFLDNASVSGNYIIHADLDFEGEIWPSSLMHGNFTGTIQGNGHTFSNISIEQTNNSKVNAGLFGYLTETANITDLKLDNVTFTIKSGTRVAGTCYGLFAGNISSDATISGVTIENSTLQVDSGCYFGADDYAIGLICGMGSADIDASGITTAAVGDYPETVVITVNGDAVTVEFVTA